MWKQSHFCNMPWLSGSSSWEPTIPKRLLASINNLATLYFKQGKYAEAEPLYQRALAIQEQRLGTEHPDTATCLNNLAAFYHEQGKYAEAEPLYQRALAIREQQLGREHPATRTTLKNYALLLRKMGRDVEAKQLEEDS